MKNVLAIDVQDAFLEFLKVKFATEDVIVSPADCARDAFTKMLSILPDLVILDMHRGLKELLTFLKQKRTNPNTQRMPIIAVGPVVDKTQMSMFAQFGIVRYFTRPMQFDVFFTAAAQAMGTDVSIDPTPCALDVRRIGNVILIDVAGSLNRDKITVLKMDMVDMVSSLEEPKVVCLMNNMSLTFLDAVNVEYLFDGILECPLIQSKNVKVIANNKFLAAMLDGHKRYNNIECVGDISKVLNTLVDSSSSAVLQDVIAEKILAIDESAPTTVMSTAFSTDK